MAYPVKQNVTIPLAMGVDTKSDPKKLQPPKHAVVQDADFDSVDQLVQRNGHTKLGKSIIGGSTIADADAIHTVGDQLLIRAKAAIYAFAGTTLNKWASTSTPAMLNYTKTVLAAGLFAVPSGGYASIGDFEACSYFFNDSAGARTLRIDIFDRTSGALLGTTTTAATAAVKTEIAVTGTTIYTLYTHSADLKFIAFDTTALTFGSATTIVAAASTDFSIHIWRDTYAAISYSNAANDLKLGIMTLPLSAVFSVAPVTVVAADVNLANPHVTVYEGANFAADSVFILFSKSSFPSNTPWVAIYSTALAATTAAKAYGAGGAGNVASIRFSGTTLNVLLAGYRRRNADHQWYSGATTVYTITTAGVVASGTTTLPKLLTIAALNASFLSETYTAAFDDNSDNYIMVKEGAYIPAASFGTGTMLIPGRFVRTSATTLEFAGLEKLRVISQADTQPEVEYQLVKYTFTYDPLQGGSSVEHGGTLITSGPCLLAHDGTTSVELGFLEQPGAPTLGSNAGAGFAAGTYQYLQVLEWYDRNGNLHRSSPSTPTTLVLGGAVLSVTVTCTAIGATAKAAPVMAAIYRTKTLDTTFYRVGSVALNTTGTSTRAFTDTTTDATLAGNEILYTTGDVLEAGPPPNASYICKHVNRIHVIDADDKNQSLYTKYLAEATVPEFNDDLVIRWDQGKGGLKALASLDEKLIGLKSETLFFVLGDGPSDTGEQDTFTKPQPIQCDTGVSEPRSVLSFPGGVLFKTVRGWYALDRSMVTTYIGAEVQRFNALVVSSCTIVPGRNQIRIMHTDGTTLVFDYIGKQWAHNSGQASIGSTLWNNQHTYAKSNGDVLYQSATQWLEDTTNIEPRIVTGWFALNGIQGFQRIYAALIMGELRSRHSIRVRVAFDMDPVWRDSFTLDSTTAAVTTTMTDESYYGATTAAQGQPTKTLQYEIKPYIQKCSSIRFEITILNTQNANLELARLSEITLVVGVKAGTKRLEVGRIIA